VGIDPSEITDAMIAGDPSGELRKLRAQALGDPRAALTSQEARSKGLRKLEREEQRILVNWLKQQEEQGRLAYDWSATNRRVTCRAGMPDFKIYRGGRVLFGEMKIDRNGLSSAQREMHERLLRSGSEVEIWVSADSAIRRIKNFIWTFFREWQQEDSGWKTLDDSPGV
jgi:hypothetical protein